MKNEYKFDVFTPTRVAKHYFALIGCQEGNLFKEYGKEIKGVHLKSSNAPKAIMLKAKQMMEDVMNTVIAEKKINIFNILKEVADIEREVIKAVRLGSFHFFRRGQIKQADSYVDKESSAAFQQYTLWQEVFAPKYGDAPPPPYLSIKISTELSTPSKTMEWMDSMKDVALRTRMKEWLVKNNKKYVKTFMLPEQCISSNGIPEEIFQVVDTRKIVLDVTKVFYLILECLGIYMLNKKSTRLVSDEY